MGTAKDRSSSPLGADPERVRLQESDTEGAGWKRWGPYVSARSWGTVREDYSHDSDSWGSFPHDQARSRAYRWAEDGLAGVSDDRQLLCLGLTLWNGVDPILKERAFGLSGPEGNHGEDVKEYWWYLDNTPTHSWMRWRYHYPQAEFPYTDLIAVNGSRGKDEPEYELLDTGIFDEGYWQVTVDYAKSSPEDLLMLITVHNAGSETKTLHVLPTLWFRNTWDWDEGGTRPELRSSGDRILVSHPELGDRVLTYSDSPTQLFCENTTNLRRLYDAEPTTSYPKDGINDHLVHGAPTVNPDLVGTKASLHYAIEVAPGESTEIRVRLAPEAGSIKSEFTKVMTARLAEADAFYAPLAPVDATEEEKMIMRQAFSGLLWSKQYCHYNVRRWLEGDPGQPKPAPQRYQGRNRDWQHLHASDIIVMPDDWEYPWFAAWDLAFHAITLAHVDAEMAKQQLLLLTNEWYMSARGQIPAYEYGFGDVNPPVQALAALRIFTIDGATDYQWLTQIFNKLLVNFTWWMNREDADGSDLFAGGFLGLDNIAPFDRDEPPDLGGRLVEVDGTSWVALFELGLLGMASILAVERPEYENVAVKFFEHFWAIALSMNEQGLWDEDDGMYYSAIHQPDGTIRHIRAHSIDALLPLVAFVVPQGSMLDRLPELRSRIDWFVEHRGGELDSLEEFVKPGVGGTHLMSVFGRERLERVLARVFDEEEFLSPYGLRAVSRWHREHPLVYGDYGTHALIYSDYGTLDYEPAESRSGMFGGNSNWRGPIWLPMNHVLIEALARLDHHFGPELTVEVPAGSGNRLRLLDASRELGRRLVSIFQDDDSGRRPVFAQYERMQTDPLWHDLLPFHEYFHGDTGAGLGAAHQTGWTALVADLITSRRFDQYVSMGGVADGQTAQPWQTPRVPTSDRES